MAGGVMATMLTACSSEEPLAEEPKGDLFVTIEARSPRASEDATSDVHSDLTLQEGIVLIYDENGVYEGGDRIDAAPNGEPSTATRRLPTSTAMSRPTRATRCGAISSLCTGITPN